ncbi:MAG: D-2-hydroxyacid dehydrogenase [Litoricola sp.]|nr:D-2-hydroxyacid dehydrogenase [Litorivicinus sp.]
MRAVFLDYQSMKPDELDFEKLAGATTEFVTHDATPPDSIVDRIQGFEVVILNKVKFLRAHFEAAPELKLILVSATGTDNVDKAAAKDHGVVVCNVTAYGTPSVSQHTLMLMLMIATQAERYRHDVQAGRWSESPMFCLMDYPIIDLAGRTLGLIGYGELGQAVGRLAEAFGMRVLVMGREGVDYSDGSERVSFDTLLEQSDFVSLHGLLNEHTAQMMNRDAFRKMKPGSFLINTARGGLVDEDALCDALESGQLAGAGLDVVTTEPPAVDSRLLNCKHPNLIITPHSAWASRESRQRIVGIMQSNLEAFIEGAPINRVA